MTLVCAAAAYGAPAAPAPPAPPAPTYADALIKDVPHVAQKPDFCGEACVEMVLKKLGFPHVELKGYHQGIVRPGGGSFNRAVIHASR